MTWKSQTSKSSDNRMGGWFFCIRWVAVTRVLMFISWMMVAAILLSKTVTARLRRYKSWTPVSTCPRFTDVVRRSLLPSSPQAHSWFSARAGRLKGPRTAHEVRAFPHHGRDEVERHHPGNDRSPSRSRPRLPLSPARPIAARHARPGVSPAAASHHRQRLLLAVARL